MKSKKIDLCEFITLNFEDFDNEELKDGAKLHSYIKERLVPGKMTYVFLDDDRVIIGTS